MKKNIVISGVNLVEGGILSILKDCVNSFYDINGFEKCDVTLLVNNRNLIPVEVQKYFSILEFPDIKHSWLKRIKFEYWTSKKLSKTLNPDLWISLHDMTPNVIGKQLVYCHNGSPFYNGNKNKLIFSDFKFFLFVKFYKYLYRINIKKNTFIIVQQNWLRKKFEKEFNVKTIVAYPFSNVEKPILTTIDTNTKKQLFSFIYPAFPRIFKNFEIILEAVSILEKKGLDFKLYITIDGNENKYSKKLIKKYNYLKNTVFLGLVSRDKVFQLYKDCNVLLFPSKLETWGLPLTEFKVFYKPILVANLDYAKEAIGNYEKVKFFDPDNAEELANYMECCINNSLTFDKNEINLPNEPFARNWEELWEYIIKIA